MELGSSPEELEVKAGVRVEKPLTGWLTTLNSVLFRLAMYLACACLAGLLTVVVYGVVLRYVFNNAPPYVEQVALLLIIAVAMFGASAGVRDAARSICWRSRFSTTIGKPLGEAPLFGDRRSIRPFLGAGRSMTYGGRWGWGGRLDAPGGRSESPECS